MFQKSAEAQKPKSAVEYKINARKALAGRIHVNILGPAFFASAPVVPADSGFTEEAAIARVQFAANSYTCTCSRGRIRLQVMCTRYALCILLA